MSGPATTVREEAACRLDGVCVSYNGRRAVVDLDLAITEGESVALVGPSGAGKTSLLRVLAGMVRPDSGRVVLAGRVPGELRPGRELASLVGMMQQQHDLVPQLSVRHNVQAGLLGRVGLLRSLALLVLPLQVPAAVEAVRRVGLPGMLGVRVAELSGGEQQRVALARMLVQNPAVVLADEPVASLDPALADDLLALLAELARRDGRIVVASLHTPGFARRHFDRIVGLRAGRIAFDLPAGEVTDEVLEALYRLAPGGPPPPE